MKKLKTLVSVILASMIGILPSCGSMGGGGGMRMEYMIDLSPSAVGSVRL